MALVVRSLSGMPYVITDSCTSVCDTACVHVCPVDAIHGPIGIEEITLVAPADRPRAFRTLQLYIDPDTCICCAACEPECPVSAIYEEDDVPERSKASIAANAAFFKR